MNAVCNFAPQVTPGCLPHCLLLPGGDSDPTFRTALKIAVSTNQQFKCLEMMNFAISLGNTYANKQGPEEKNQ